MGKQSQIENEPKTARKKRKSVPDFAMLSEINSELDLAAHTLRLQTLREDMQMKAQNDEENDEKLSPVAGSSSSSPTADSKTVFKEKLLNGNDGMDVSLEVEAWNDNISTRHGCFYYFCCCCIICNLFCNPKRYEDY